MTIAEAAAALGLAKATLQKQARRGRLRTRRDRWDRYVVSAAEVDRYRREVLGRPGRKAGEA